MTQFDPSMVAQMLMQPVGRESLNNKVADENYFAAIEIPSPSMVAPLDMDTGMFMSPETAGKIAYGGAVTGASFFPGAGVVDAAGGAVDIHGQPLPSFGENIGQGNYLDAALQGLGVAGDVATVAAPVTGGLSLALAAALKAPRAAQKIDKATDVASDVSMFPSMDKASRLERARELGFDVDNPIYHGTNTDKLTEFDESKIGSRDEGFFGRGFYFADNAGEAKFYGENVGEYFVRGDLLDLTDTSGEPNYLGSPLVFINWAEKLDKIDMLDDTHKQALKGAKKVVKYFDENVTILPAQNADGTTGYTAKIIDPTRDPFDGDPKEIFMRSRYDDDFPKTQEEAKERLFYQFADDVRTNQYKDTDFFEGFNDDFLFSLSDYIRVGGEYMGINSSNLTKKAKAAGFDGIRAGDETVIFDAKNIRSSDAAFDPNLKDSANLLDNVHYVTPPTETNVLQFDAEKQKVQKPANQNLLPRDETSGHAADHVPAQFGPPAHDMNMKIEEEFTPDGFSTMSTDMGENYENLKHFVSSARGTPEYNEEVAFYRKLFQIKGNPDAEITIYRASPTDDLRYGDLITPIKSDAEFYVKESKITRDDIIESQRKARLESDEPINLKKEKNIRIMENIMGLFPEPEVSVSKVYTYKVKAKDIRWDGNNGLIRWGYFPDSD